MAIVERPTVFGIDLPCLDKKITPDLSGRKIYRVRIHGLEGGELTEGYFFQLRLLAVRSENWIIHYPPGGPERFRTILSRKEINEADIELRAKKFKVFGAKIRWKEE